MKLTNRKIAASLAALGMAFGLAACSDEAGPGPTTGPVTTDPGTTGPVDTGTFSPSDADAEVIVNKALTAMGRLNSLGGKIDKTWSNTGHAKSQGTTREVRTFEADYAGGVIHGRGIDPATNKGSGWEFYFVAAGEGGWNSYAGKDSWSKNALVDGIAIDGSRDVREDMLKLVSDALTKDSVDWLDGDVVLEESATHWQVTMKVKDYFRPYEGAWNGTVKVIIDKETNYVTQESFVGTMDYDFSAGGGTSMIAPPSGVTTMDVTVTLFDYNEIEKIVVPQKVLDAPEVVY